MTKFLIAADMLAQALESFKERNSNLFAFMHELEDKVPSPNVEFCPETGELQFSWLLGKNKLNDGGMVYLRSCYDDKYQDRGVELTVRMRPEIELLEKINPTSEEVIDYICQK